MTIWCVDDGNKAIEQVVEFTVGPLGVILSPEPAPVAIGKRRQNEDLFASLRGGEEWTDLPGTRYEVLPHYWAAFILIGESD